MFGRGRLPVFFRSCWVCPHTLGRARAGTFSIFIAALAVIALLAFGLISKGEDALAVCEELPETELPVLTMPVP